jgi:hypothetical protein
MFNNTRISQIFFLLLLVIVTTSFAGEVICDADSDCFYISAKIKKSNLPESGRRDEGSIRQVPALIYLSCGGATAKDLDSIKIIGDSLKWILASCHESRNHRNAMLNDRDIIKTYQKLVKDYKVDTNRIFIYGFSGMGVQALMEVFLHPNKFRGVVAVCAHSQAFSLANWGNLGENLFYLVSRKRDWNLSENLLMHKKFQEYRVRDTLIITPGEHKIGDKFELLEACSWLNKNSELNKKP